MNKRLLEQSAVRVSPEKFTWMKYKGIKTKLLTHTKRNGDKIKTRLEPNDVFGYREVKLRSTGKELIQVVLKSNDMDLAYNLSPRSFNTNILKNSRATVLPKKFKKPIDIKAIDKKARGDAPIEDKPVAKKNVLKPNSIVWESDDGLLYLKYVGKSGTVREFEGYKKVKGNWKRCAEISTDKGLEYAIESITKLHGADSATRPVAAKPDHKMFDNQILDAINGQHLHVGIKDLVGATRTTLVVGSTANLYSVTLEIENPLKLQELSGSEIQARLNDSSSKGLYQDVTANAFSKITFVYESVIKEQKFNSFRAISPVQVTAVKRKGVRVIKVLLGYLPNVDQDTKTYFGIEDDKVSTDIDLGDGYLYDLSPDGNGYLATFISPKDLADRKVILWKVDPQELRRQAEQTKDAHQNSPYLTKRWDSKWGKVVEVFLDDAPRLDEPASEMYGIIYEDGSFRKAYGYDMDKLISEQQIQSTPEWQEQNVKDIEARERARQKSLELKTHNDKVLEDLTKHVTEWLDTTAYTPLQKGKILKTLLTRVNYSGTINGILTRGEFVRTMVEDMKAETSTREEDKYKRPTRSRWNNMNALEQQEFEERQRLGITKTIYSIGNYDVTRYEYLYAKYLGA